MSISDGLTSIAEVKVSGMSGIRGVGISRLQFSVEMNLQATKGYSAKIDNLLCFVFVGESLTGPFLPVGSAVPETSWFANTHDFYTREFLIFKLDLAGQQLESLEKMRAGGALFFRLDFHCNVEGRQGLQRSFEQLMFEANVSLWAGILKDLGCYDCLLLSLELPVSGMPETLDVAIMQIHEAYADLVTGRFDSVVRRVRISIEGVDKCLDEGALRSTAIKNFANTETRKKMPKLERASMVRSAIRHYANLAHHVDELGEVQSYSRHDAVFMLSAAAAMVWEAAGQVLAAQPRPDADVI